MRYKIIAAGLLTGWALVAIATYPDAQEAALPKAGDATLLPLPDDMPVFETLVQEPKGLITEPTPEDWLLWTELGK